MWCRVFWKSEYFLWPKDMVCFVDLFYLFIYLIKVRISYIIFFIWFLYRILFDIYHRVEKKFLNLMIYMLYISLYLKSLIFIALFFYLSYIFILFIKQVCLINFFILLEYINVSCPVVGLFSLRDRLVTLIVVWYSIHCNPRINWLFDDLQRF